MAYDEGLAELMRNALDDRSGIQERKMFGGLCFLLNGNMLCGVSGTGQYMFRVGKEAEADALLRPGSSPVEFNGRKMGGIVWVEVEAAMDRDLETWIELAADFAGHLPAK
jgi:TfoX/Sxy family transcriptional regulator of competence genes